MPVWYWPHPLNPTFILVKMAFTGVYNIFIISDQQTLLEPPHPGGSN